MKLKNDKRGFTILEVLIATVIIGIGLVAMMAMQVAFVNGTSTARDTTIATALGESVVEQLRTEGAMWNSRSPAFTPGELTQAQTPMLFTGARTNGGQFAFLSGLGSFPVNHVGITRNPAATYANRTLGKSMSAINGKYCIDARMEFMSGSNDEVIIGQVRVAWPSDKAAPWLGAPVDAPVECSSSDGLNSVIYRNGNFSSALGDINVVHVPFSIKRHTI